MGFLRMLFTYLMRNEKLIEKLANTKPIRQSAQFVAYLILQSRTHGIHLSFDREKFARQLRLFRNTFRQKLQEAKDEMKKNPPK